MSKFHLAETGLVLVSLIWGVTFVVVKKTMGAMDPFVFNFLRFTMAGVLVFAWILVFQPGFLKQLNRTMIWHGLFLGLWQFSGYGFLTCGLVHTSPTNAGFITGLNVIMVPVFSVLFIKQKIDQCLALGVITALFGLYFLTVKDSMSLNMGDFLVLMGAIAFSFHVIFTEKFAQRHATLLLVFIQLIFVGLASLVYASLFEDLSVLADKKLMFSFNILISLFVVVLLATGLALLVQTWAQKKISAVKVALIYSLEPVFAAVSGYYWADDIFDRTALIGCVLIFFGMMIVDLPKYLKIFEASKKVKQLNKLVRSFW